MPFRDVQRRARARLARIVARTLARRGAPPPPDWGARPHRVLFLRHDRIGDMILSTGLLRAIATSHATIALDVLASPANASVLREEPAVDRIIVLDLWKPWTYPMIARRMRRRRYDAVIDCMPAAPSLTTLLLMLASGARHRVGIAGRGIDEALTIHVAPRAGADHIVDLLSALAVPFGVDPGGTDWRPVLVLDDDERRAGDERWRATFGGMAGRRLLVNLSAGRDFRSWPDARFVAVLRAARARAPDLQIALIGAPDERVRVDAVARATGARAVRTPRFRDALALVAASDCVFTPDTSIAHAAAAFRRPAVVMYSHGYERRWGLYQSPGICVSSPERALASLAAEPVVEALADVLARVPARGGAGPRETGVMPESSIAPVPPRRGVAPRHRDLPRR